MPGDDILYRIEDQVATITINRPETLNAFTDENMEEISARIFEAGDDSKVGVIVLTGTGERAFSSGGDVNWEAEGGIAQLDFQLDRHIVDCPKPIIARVNGYAIGGGHHIAYFCDLTIAADHAIFGQNGARVGSPAAGHIVAHATNVLGQKRGRELWMLCRRYTAQQALDWGLANAVVPMAEIDAETRKWADEMLSLSPTCLKILKASFRKYMDPMMEVDMNDILDEAAPGYFDTGEQEEGARAFLEKRKADFSPWR